MRDILSAYPGHAYELEDGQPLAFLCKDKSGEIVSGGTTCEEIIEVLIDRIGKLNQAVPCRENREALVCLHRAAQWLEYRTRKRIERGVEGTMEP